MKVKKYLTIFFLLFFFTGTLLAQAEKEKKWTAGVLSGLFFLQDEIFQEVYGKSTLFLGAEITFPLSKLIRNMEGVFHFKYVTDKGETSFTKEEIKLQLFNLSLSLRYIMNLNKFKLFLGPGVDYIFYGEKYPETFPRDSMNGSVLGFHILGGSYYSFSSSFAAKIYFKHDIAETTEEGIRVNLGGTEWGIGLIYCFDL